MTHVKGWLVMRNLEEDCVAQQHPGTTGQGIGCSFILFFSSGMTLTLIGWKTIATINPLSENISQNYRNPQQETCSDWNKAKATDSQTSHHGQICRGLGM